MSGPYASAKTEEPPPPKKPWLPAPVAKALIFILAIGAVLLFSFVAWGHDHEHPELSQWYESLHSSAGSPCCDKQDFDKGTATSLSDAEWDGDGKGHYRVKIEGQWVDVPETAHVLGPNKDGRPIVWFWHLNGEPMVRCFIPGAGG